ncbi:cyclase family protein [Flavobacterium suncheonense]|uniref:Cyclase n=1 Tax=Flavobacterium suncheonense GH29-5 = DSM 17707 TaxID=1121899 RepID=A0A0A2MQV6_9FLAO|nr:cyclase family protein [Flavobacterium suncheonense]KGO90630.1 cyclase [Flavobacterium suncheonense GH29-5 = DSM 17707]
MKYFIFASLLLGLSSCVESEKKQTLSELLAAGKWIDLTYDFSETTIYWPNNPTGFQLKTQFNGMTAGGYFYASNEFYTPEHGGTHLDAPIHFAKGKWSADQIPLERLNGNAILIDIRAKAQNNADYQISISDVEAWEKNHGNIPEGSFVLFRTGWGKFYPDKAKYLGTAVKGEAAIPHLHFPGIDPVLATWLVKNRTIKAVGIDTPSIDYGQSKDFKTHQILCAENILGFENLANLQELPEIGIYLIALPMKIKDGTGGPLRIIAWVENPAN